MKNLSKQGLIIILCLGMLLQLGCGKKMIEQQPQSQVLTGVSRYFPAKPGMTWAYEGQGNEYAAFRSGVVLREGVKAQLYQDNGGTRMGLVYELDETAVVMVYAQEEYYNDAPLIREPQNRRKTILKMPLTPGQVWENSDERREVVAIDAVTKVPAGEYRDVVKIKVISLHAAAAGPVYEYYALNVGLIKKEYIAGNFVVVSRLIEFKNSP